MKPMLIASTVYPKKGVSLHPAGSLISHIVSESLPGELLSSLVLSRAGSRTFLLLFGGSLLPVCG